MQYAVIIKMEDEDGRKNPVFIFDTAEDRQDFIDDIKAAGLNYMTTEIE